MFSVSLRQGAWNVVFFPKLRVDLFEKPIATSFHVDETGFDSK